MKRAWPFAVAILICSILPARLMCQENCQNKDQAKCQDNNKEPETYGGEPLCPSRRGVFPRGKYTPPPEYGNKDVKVEGSVFLSVIVTKEGTTADVKVTKGLTPWLDKQAIKAVSQWRFEPVTREDGQPCATRVAVQTQFHNY
jgi:TonB family protein